MGKDYLARWRGSPVEIRVLSEEAAALEAAAEGSGADEAELFLSHPALEGLRREVELRAALRHPNVLVRGARRGRGRGSLGEKSLGVPLLPFSSGLAGGQAG